jgi:ADP-heptose:LPS heptosyltransferase
LQNFVSLSVGWRRPLRTPTELDLRKAQASNPLDVNADPRNILVIHFGQLGDVVMGLPAMRAVRDRFPDAKVSALVGSATAEVVKLAGLFDEVIDVDRVRLLKGKKFSSSIEIVRFAFSIRRRQFDFVIDLHSLPETNLLAYFSGAGIRLLANRESRSLDRLSNFRPPPPVEDKKIHLSQYYLDVLSPLGISGKAEAFAFERLDASEGPAKPIVGINPGAGSPSRRWPVENFIELARRILDSDKADIEVLIGPEDTALADSFKAALQDRCTINTGVGLRHLIASVQRFAMVVSNDTGPAHIAAACGAPIVLLCHTASPDRYLPLATDLVVHRGDSLGDIQVDAVHTSVTELLDAAR